MAMLAPDIEVQIRALAIRPDRALVVCDVDEVVVHFLRAFEDFLGENELWLDPASFALNGNVRRREGNQPVPTAELGELITRFFAERARRLEPIEGAQEALSSLARSAQVVLLSNIPAAFRDDRLANLAAHGLAFPLVVNQGPKGPAVKAMIERHAASVVFIDDVPGYLTSVAEHCPAASLVHFLQDQRFGRHVGRLECVSLRTDNWREAHDHIRGLLSRAKTPKLV
jgi:hypothetical protein